MSGSTLLDGGGNPVKFDQASVAFGLAMFPTVFNTCNLLVMIWLTKAYVKVVCWIMPAKHRESDEEFALKYIGRGLLGTSELNLAQAQKEIVVYGERVQRMIGMAESMLAADPDSQTYIDNNNRIEKYEDISDHMELEIGQYLNKVAEGRLSPEGKKETASMLRIISEIESIADSCMNVAKTLNRKNQNKVRFDDWVLAQLDGMFHLVDGAMENMLALLREMEAPDEVRVIDAYNREREINNYRNRLRDANISNINDRKYSYQEGIFFMDLIGEAEKLGDYILNVVEGVKHQFKEETI